jgi:putative endonuclease
MSGLLTRLALQAMDQAARLVLRPPEQPPHLQTGRHGEELAYFYLRQMGYVIVARNYRSHRRQGEIDMVGWDNGVLCFIEVKTRTTRDVKPAEAAVDMEKQRDLRGMAREYLQCNPRKPNVAQKDRPYRFDVLSIYLLDGTNPVFTLFKNAFSVS